MTMTTDNVPAGHMFAVPDTVIGCGGRQWFYRFENGHEYAPLGWDGAGIIPGWDSERRFEWGSTNQRVLPLLGLVQASDAEFDECEPLRMVTRAVVAEGAWGPETCPTTSGEPPLAGPIPVHMHFQAEKEAL